MVGERIRAGLTAVADGDGAETLVVARDLIRTRGEGNGTGPASALTAALAIGFATGPDEAERRRRIVERVSAPADDDSLAAACAIAAMAAYAACGTPMFSVFAAGLEEAGSVRPAAREPLTRAATGSWSAPEGEDDPAGVEAVAAVVSVLCSGREAQNDTVDVLARAIAAAREAGEEATADPDVEALADGLAGLRG